MAIELRQAAPAPLVDVANLTIRYPGTTTPAVDRVTLTVAPGETVAIVGESGSGKSTLARAIAGLITDPATLVESTSLRFDGVPIGRDEGAVLPEHVPGISMMFQDASTSLDALWTVGDQLVAVLRDSVRMTKRAARAEAREWLHRVGLTDDERVLRARPYELSGGMRQRVMLAIALASKPRLLIADEPTSALDASLSRLSMQLMTELGRELGTALLIVSHDIAMCTEFSDRIAVMYRGSIVDGGPSSSFARTAVHPYARGLLACVPTFEHLEDDRLPTLDEYLQDAQLRGGRSEAAA
ncbi:ABC transporter ATP-binding protein [Microbacteriaceae bacterium VKM Ac-2855]|nr:ABC transporter ATP-binding protein [Microbacteriaceae bacterium VKM Ac-2855]